MTKDAFLSLCAALPGARIDQPFPEDFVSTVARHGDSRRWFALYMRVDGREIVNLKCDMLRADLWKSQFSGVLPAYHMNKQHWITVALQSDVPDSMLEAMVWDSFELTRSKKRGSVRRPRVKD